MIAANYGGKSLSKKDDGAKKKDTWLATRAILAAYVGMTFEQMSSKQQAQFVTALAQLLDVMDEAGIVKPLG